MRKLVFIVAVLAAASMGHAQSLHGLFVRDAAPSMIYHDGWIDLNKSAEGNSHGNTEAWKHGRKQPRKPEAQKKEFGT